MGTGVAGVHRLEPTLIHPADLVNPTAAAGPTAGRRLLRVVWHVLRLAARAVTLRHAHRLLPERIEARGLGFAVASLLYAATALLRDSALSTLPPGHALLLHGAAYGALLLVSWPGRLREFMLFLCTSIGAHLVGAAWVLLAGDHAPTPPALLLWPYGAMLVAMVQMGLANGSGDTSRP
jgi:hypothetical protein